MNPDKLDETAAEKKATDHEIKEYVMAHYGYKIPNLYIAQIKQKCGFGKNRYRKGPLSGEACQIKDRQ